MTWAKIASLINEQCRYKKLQSTALEAVAIAHEFVNHLRENQMAESDEKEIYIRQLSGDSLELFFRYRIYKCQSKFAKSALQHLYFSPLFTARAPKDFAERSMLPIEKGVSYFARINEGRVVKRNQVLEYLKSVGHHSPKAAASEILDQTSMKEFLVLVLGDIFQLFQTPIYPSFASITISLVFVRITTSYRLWSSGSSIITSSLIEDPFRNSLPNA